MLISTSLAQLHNASNECKLSFSVAGDRTLYPKMSLTNNNFSFNLCGLIRASWAPNNIICNMRTWCFSSAIWKAVYPSLFWTKSISFGLIPASLSQNQNNSNAFNLHFSAARYLTLYPCPSLSSNIFFSSPLNPFSTLWPFSTISLIFLIDFFVLPRAMHFAQSCFLTKTSHNFTLLVSVAVL